jgi:hypothetical protein
MLATTPVDGSHVFVDVIAGRVVATFCLAAAGPVATGADRSRATIPTTKIVPPGAGEEHISLAHHL